MGGERGGEGGVWTNNDLNQITQDKKNNNNKAGQLFHYTQEVKGGVRMGVDTNRTWLLRSGVTRVGAPVAL